jgi:hypothetical protein
MAKKAAWKKEKQEHPWATKKQAKRIAKDHATKKRRTTKRTRTQANFNQPLKLINTGMKATVGIAALGITANAVTKIAKP